MKVRVLVSQSCLTLCDPMDYNPPGSTVHGILQAGVLECINEVTFRNSNLILNKFLHNNVQPSTDSDCVPGKFYKC